MRYQLMEGSELPDEELNPEDLVLYDTYNKTIIWVDGCFEPEDILLTRDLGIFVSIINELQDEVNKLEEEVFNLRLQQPLNDRIW